MKFPSSIRWLVLCALLPTPASAATWYIAPDGDDAAAGSEAAPWRSFAHALDQLQSGDVLRVRGGTYRLVTESGGSALTTRGVTIEAYPGETPRILGSASTAGRAWQAVGPDLWRWPADQLERDPTGMFEGSRRIVHATDFSSGRDHADIALLDADDMWTKADAAGNGCGQANTGCFIYLRSSDGDPNGREFELAQRGLTRVAGDDVTVRGLTFLYTQPQPIFFEFADRVLLEDNVFGHVSNGNDNSYGVRIWESQGSIVRRNEVFDSVYWGGTSNSKGITFMLTRPGAPNIVEHNYVHDIPGRSAVGTKGGVSNLIVRYNRIENVYMAFEVGDARCVWTSSNDDGCQPSDDEYRPAGNWRIYGNVVRNSEIGLGLPGYIQDGNHNWLYNNVFDQVETGVDIGWQGTTGTRIANNIFLGSRAAIYLQSGGTTTSVTDYLDQFSADHNLYFGSTMADVHLRPNWGGNYASGTSYTLAQFRSEFGREMNSLAAAPDFALDWPDYRLAEDSPATGAGDAGFWPGRAAVDIGAHPLPGMMFHSGFEFGD